MHAEKIGVPFWLNHRGAPFFVAARMARMRLGSFAFAVRRRASVRMGLWGIARMTRIFLKKYIHTITCHPANPTPMTTVHRIVKKTFSDFAEYPSQRAASHAPQGILGNFRKIPSESSESSREEPFKIRCPIHRTPHHLPDFFPVAPQPPPTTTQTARLSTD